MEELNEEAKKSSPEALNYKYSDGTMDGSVGESFRGKEVRRPRNFFLGLVSFTGLPGELRSAQHCKYLKYKCYEGATQVTALLAFRCPISGKMNLTDHGHLQKKHSTIKSRKALHISQL